jgi:sarcosine oxidase subunit beta
MKNPVSYDVILIGAGSIGAPAAMYLAQEGLGVLVVEKFASAGQGSNKAAIGGVRATHSDPAKIRLGLRSLEVFSTWRDVWGDDIEWRSGGYCFLAYTEQDETTLKNLLEVQQAYGLNIGWKTAREIQALIPDVNPVNLRGGTFSPEDGYCSNLLANHAFYRKAVQAGADFHFKETVTNIHLQSGRVIGITTDRGSYSSPVVINTAGAWASAIGEMAGLSHPVRPDSHEAGITEPVRRFLEPMIVDIRPGTCSANVYFYQQNTRQINFCLTPDPQIWGDNCQETSDFLPLVSRRVIELVPRLANLRIRRTWRGLYHMTPDGSPIIGWSEEVKGYLMAIGMCGQGFMFGPGVGELLTRMVNQTELDEHDQEILHILRPQREFAGKETLK